MAPTAAAPAGPLSRWRARATTTDISLDVWAGEVLGVYGFMGSGQIELARSLFGKLRADSGTLSSDGKVLHLRSTAAARRAGIAFVPESRRSMLFYREPVYKNMSISVLGRIARLLLKPAVEKDIARRHVEALSIRPPTVETLLGRSHEELLEAQTRPVEPPEVVGWLNGFAPVASLKSLA